VEQINQLVQKGLVMANETYGRYFLIKTLARAAFAAVVLAAAAAHAEAPRFGTQHQGGNQYNDYNWLAGGG
jgi:hypothetical protein